MKMTETHGTLTRPDGATIAYRGLRRKAPSEGPGVMFFSGFRSDMTGAKAEALAVFCRERGIDFTRFDYQGHGVSSGRFEDGTIGRWKDDAVAVLDAVAEGPQVLVGSSMGGWMMLLAALARPERVAGLVGIASAPDFTERLIWEQLVDADRHTLLDTGVWHAPSCYDNDPYPITRTLIEEGRNHLLLSASIPLRCPVRLLHGMRDEDVSWHFSTTLAEKLESADVEVTLVKDAGHRMSEPSQLALLMKAVEELRRVLSYGHSE